MCWAQIYTALRNRIVSAQPMDRQAHLSQCLEKLMADVQRNLEPKNRDKFTQVHPSSPSAECFTPGAILPFLGSACDSAGPCRLRPWVIGATNVNFLKFMCGAEPNERAARVPEQGLMACRDNNCTSVHSAACMLVRPSTAEAGPCPVTKTCLTRWARQVFLLVWRGE